MGLNGKRALVQDIDRTREAAIIYYPSEGEGDNASVWFDGDPEPITVHKSRVHRIIPNRPTVPPHGTNPGIMEA